MEFQTGGSRDRKNGVELLPGVGYLSSILSKQLCGTEAQALT